MSLLSIVSKNFNVRVMAVVSNEDVDDPTGEATFPCAGLSV